MTATKAILSSVTAIREGAGKLFEGLSHNYSLAVLSGDNESEKAFLEELLPPLTPLYFNQKPKEKLAVCP